MKKLEWAKVYDLPSIKGEGWARVILTSDGMFSTCSDWGNYAFWWGCHGCCDFREFVIGLVGSVGYVCSKFCSRPYPYDGDATLQSVKQHIVEERRAMRTTREEAREEWDLLREHEDLENEFSFVRWLDDTKLGDAYEFAAHSPPGDAVGFCKHIFPRLAELLKAEMAAERKPLAAVDPFNGGGMGEPNLAREIADAILQHDGNGADFNVSIALVPNQHVIVRVDAACGTVQCSRRIDLPALRDATMPSSIVAHAIANCIEGVAEILRR